MLNFRDSDYCCREMFLDSIEEIYTSSKIIIDRLISDYFIHEKHVSWNNIHNEIIYKYPNGIGYLASKAHFVILNSNILISNILIKN